MNCLLINIAIIVLIIGICFVVKYNDWKEFLGYICIILSGAALLVCLIVGVSKSETYSLFERNYKETVYLIKTYNIENDEDLYTLSTVLNEAKKLNKEIEKNKKSCDNLFYGCLFNKKIGEFEPISTENLLKIYKEK